MQFIQSVPVAEVLATEESIQVCAGLGSDDKELLNPNVALNQIFCVSLGKKCHPPPQISLS